MMYVKKIKLKRQIVIPAYLRRQPKIEPGDRLIVTADTDGLVLRPVREKRRERRKR